MKRALAESPVTIGISLLWVAVFVVMVWLQPDPEPSLRRFLFGAYIQTTTSHALGDLTARELYAGQVWRTLTATFVHFNLLHLVLNMLGLIQLGRMIESWYGSAQFLAIYVAIAVLGNLLAGASRPWLSDDPMAATIHSGGGSTVVLGLIGLVTVVGWRFPSEFPRHARTFSVVILLLNAVMGFLLPNIDNLGHAAGALVGAAVGWVDRSLINASNRLVSRLAGLLGLAVILACGTAMIQHFVSETSAATRFVRGQRLALELARLELLYVHLTNLGREPKVSIAPEPPNPLRLPTLLLPPTEEALQSEISRSRSQLRNVIRNLSRSGLAAGPGDSASAYRGLLRLADRALKRLPTPLDLLAFRARLRPLARRNEREMEDARRALERLRYPPPIIAADVLKKPARR